MHSMSLIRYCFAIVLLTWGRHETDAVTLFDIAFQTSSQSFTYSDNTFRGATQGRYASGRHATGTGTAAYLEVTLGGVDWNRISGMSGGWYRDFSLPQRSVVEIRLNYEIIMSSQYERDEFAETLCSVDGTLLGSSPTIDSVAKVFGRGALTTSGWAKLNNVTLNSGNHRIIIGGYNNLKTELGEKSIVRIRNVKIDYTPVAVPVNVPVKLPTKVPTKRPTRVPTKFPTKRPTRVPTKFPTKRPTRVPTKFPTKKPTKAPIKSPTKAPTSFPTMFPTKKPTKAPIKSPTKAPTSVPTKAPSKSTTKSPTKAPTTFPTKSPTKVPIVALDPAMDPTKSPTMPPTKSPTMFPTKSLTNAPIIALNPTAKPFEIRINAGSDAEYIDPTGRTWVADTFYGNNGGIFSDCPKVIAGTDSDALYCKERYFNKWVHAQPFIYDITVPRPGAYNVSLHFAEIYHTEKGKQACRKTPLGVLPLT